MLQKSLFSSVALTCLMLSHLSADDMTQNPCGMSPHPERVTVRHIEGNGIGYKQGYTTLEGFFTTIEPCWGSWVPFLDVRGHVFNNGKPAVNAGLGMRYMTSSRVWGMNAYYDYRNTTHQHYNQVAAGLESLGRIWDFRINGYLPVGDKTSSVYGNAKFAGFSGNSMYLRRKKEVSFKGANAEVGVHLDGMRHAPVYAAAGPYWIDGHGKASWGGEGRISIELYKYVRLEASGSYDSIFKWIGQGQVSFNIPFGGRRQIKQGNSSSCTVARSLSKRALQRVDRMEIIPVKRRRTVSEAIDPATGKPYVFWFVNNTSHSAGTYSSPFPTLAQAQNASGPGDVIYVYAGDGTSNGMNQGITLQDNQKLFGAGNSQSLATTLGMITIPAQGSGMPSITGPSGFITTANNNEIAGIHVVINDGSLSAIVCNNINNTYIHNNLIDASAVVTGNNASGLLYLTNTGGNIIFENNTMLIGNSNLSGNLFGITLFSTAPGAIYTFNNNQFTSPISNGSTGIQWGSTQPVGSLDTLEISNNLFFGLGYNGSSSNANGYAADGNGFSGTGHIIISENTFNQVGGALGDVTGVGIAAGGNLQIDYSNNVFVHSQQPTVPSIYIYIEDPTAKASVNLVRNISDVTSTFAYFEDNSQGGTLSANNICNVGTISILGTVTVGLSPSPAQCAAGITGGF